MKKFDISLIINNAEWRAKIAKKCRITRQAIYWWAKKGQVPIYPDNHVPIVEKITGIPRHRLRPDIYPPPATPLARKLAKIEMVEKKLSAPKAQRRTPQSNVA